MERKEPFFRAGRQREGGREIKEREERKESKEGRKGKQRKEGKEGTIFPSWTSTGRRERN